MIQLMFITKLITRFVIIIIITKMLHLPDITLLSISGTDHTNMFLEHFAHFVIVKKI
jgi:hypothetical protein